MWVRDVGCDEQDKPGERGKWSTSVYTRGQSTVAATAVDTYPMTQRRSLAWAGQMYSRSPRMRRRVSISCVQWMEGLL